VRLAGCILGGLLFGLSWPPVGIWIFAFTMPAVLFLAISSQDLRTRSILVVAFFSAAWSVAFHWNAMHPVGATAFSSVVALFAMICIQAAFVSVLSSNKLIGALFSIPALWGMLGVALFDWLMMHGPLAMPGTMLGLSVSDSVIADMWVPIAGSFSLTLVVLVVNGILVATVLKRRLHVASLVLGTLLVGIPMLGSSEPLGTTSARLGITAIQPGISPSEWANVSDSSKTLRLEALLAGAHDEFPHTGVFVFPETSLPIANAASLRQTVQKWASKFNASVIAGGIELDESGGFFNVVVGSDGSPNPFLYRKRRLVPFVEAVPLGEYLPFSDRFQLDSGGVTSYGEGSILAPYDLRGTLVGSLICFESFFPSDARSLSLARADLIVVPTQDGWWNSQAARAQHLAYTRLLALAAGIPIVQTAVDGDTAMFSAQGTVVAKSRSNNLEYVHAEIPLERVETMYLQLGDSPSNVILICLLLIYLIGYSSSRYRRN
jgi:apolipoprotein N-acyltransferase